MWKVIGISWPSSRMNSLNVDYSLLKSKVLISKIKKVKTKKEDKYKLYDKDLGVDFPSSRFN